MCWEFIIKVLVIDTHYQLKWPDGLTQCYTPPTPRFLLYDAKSCTPVLLQKEITKFLKRQNDNFNKNGTEWDFKFPIAAHNETCDKCKREQKNGLTICLTCPWEVIGWRGTPFVQSRGSVKLFVMKSVNRRNRRVAAPAVQSWLCLGPLVKELDLKRGWKPEQTNRPDFEEVTLTSTLKRLAGVQEAELGGVIADGSAGTATASTKWKGANNATCVQADSTATIQDMTVGAAGEKYFSPDGVELLRKQAAQIQSVEHNYNINQLLQVVNDTVEAYSKLMQELDQEYEEQLEKSKEHLNKKKISLLKLRRNNELRCELRIKRSNTILLMSRSLWTRS